MKVAVVMGIVLGALILAPGASAKKLDRIPAGETATYRCEHSFDHWSKVFARIDGKLKLMFTRGDADYRTNVYRRAGTYETVVKTTKARHQRRVENRSNRAVFYDRDFDC